MQVTVAPSTDSAFEADQALLTGVLREVIALGEGEAALALLDEAVELGSAPVADPTRMPMRSRS